MFLIFFHEKLFIIYEGSFVVIFFPLGTNNYGYIKTRKIFMSIENTNQHYLL